MTAPAKNASAPKNTPPAVKKDENPPADNKVEVTEVTKDETPTDRVPTLLRENSIFADFCDKYLGVLDEIAEYNKAVLAEKDSEWNTSKVMEKARLFARPIDKGVEADKDILDAVKAYEAAVDAMNNARKSVLEKTSKKLGITLSATSERNPELEGPLKEKRKVANEIGSQLGMIAKMTSNDAAEQAITEFLGKNPLPAIGRDQVRTFGTDGGATPKFRVKVTITKDGKTLLEEDGFTKTALALTKQAFGYERGKAPKSDTLREVWQKAGNTPEKTTQPTVEFDDNGLHFVITKK